MSAEKMIGFISTRALFKIFIVIILFSSKFVHFCVGKSENEPDISSLSSSYGVDVSMPIHRRVSNNYPSLPHNIDPLKSPSSPVFKEMPLQILGDRQRVYNEHLSGCHEHYLHDRSQCDIYEYDRILMNLRQPQSMQNYTSTGFVKVKAPVKVKKLIVDFWDKNKLNQIEEAWPKGNTYTNHWKSPTYMISVDDSNLRGSGRKLKEEIWAATREVLEDWTEEDLSPTSMYGIRVYTEGAMILPHVDRLPLVVSAMVNVAQEVQEDWPMEIYDHDGIAHNVTLHPGEMLLWESHSILHGRPFPLNGRMYAMLFIHFEPTGHSLRHGAEGSIVTNVNEQYKMATSKGVGGQTASDRGLPPYIIRESPEEAHWRSLHPEGWQEPDFSPLKRNSSSRLHRAAASGDVAEISDAIEDSESQIKERILDMRDEDGWQLIHEGAANGHKNVVELLVDYGADINARTHGGHGGSPLFVAEKNNGRDHPIVIYLSSLGALSLGPDL